MVVIDAPGSIRFSAAIAPMPPPVDDTSQSDDRLFLVGAVRTA
jgi:hypothetical protein